MKMLATTIRNKIVIMSDPSTYSSDRDSGDDDGRNWYEDGGDPSPTPDEDDEQCFMNSH